MTYPQIAVKFGIGITTVRRWRKQNAPFDNPEAMELWMAAHPRARKSSKDPARMAWIQNTHHRSHAQHLRKLGAPVDNARALADWKRITRAITSLAQRARLHGLRWEQPVVSDCRVDGWMIVLKAGDRVLARYRILQSGRTSLAGCNLARQ